VKGFVMMTRPQLLVQRSGPGCSTGHVRPAASGPEEDAYHELRRGSSVGVW
jgi:hypothetical protein